MKKLLCVALILLMLIPTMSAFCVSAATGSCGDSVNWTLSGGTLTISGTGAMKNYDYFNKAPWYDSRASIKKVIIGDGVTTVGNYAFYQCSTLTSITFPSSGLVSIGDEAIRECDSLVTLTLPEGLESIGLIAIAYNPRLESVYIPDSVSRIRNMAFAQCTALKNIEYPESVTEVEGYIFSGCTAIESITLPEGITKIGLGAFEVCEKLSYINIPDTVTYIRSSAFAYCNSLKTITLPKSITKMDTDVFHNTTSVTVECYENSYAHNYCVSNSIRYSLATACEHEYKSEVTVVVGCTEEGVTTHTCTKCGDSYTDSIAPLGHAWLDWTVTKEATTTACGEERRDCRRGCGAYETRETPMLEITDPVLSILNYDIMLTMAEDISYIRYAAGEYTTSSEIKNAEGCVTLNATKIAEYTDNGVVTVAMPDGGIYSLWVKMSNGREYIYTADLSIMEPEVELYGVTVTLKNLYGVKDYFIAKGEYDNYTELRPNSLVQITQNKIKGAHEFSYILSEAGLYTICVRYADASRAYTFIPFEVIVTEPVFTENGLQLVVGNLDDIKVIRTAYGKYNTPGEIKRAEGARGFSGKTMGNEYMIQYREEGVVTVAVVYNNGYEVMYTYNVAKKTPSVTQNGNIVSFGNLNGLFVIRYAEGEYTTSKQIKNAPGNRVIKSEDVLDGYITVTLDPGIYTFYVQYDDESYNYYNIVVE